MGASDNQLSFDLDDLQVLRQKTGTVCQELETRKQQLKKGIYQLRKDWRTPAGEYFFANMDSTWEQDIVKFKNTMDKFEEVIQIAINEFEVVAEQAESINL